MLRSDDPTHSITAPDGRLAPASLQGDGGAPPAPPGARRLLAEALVAFACYQALVVCALDVLRTSTKSFYGDVLTGFFGPDKHGIASFLRDGFLPLWARDQYGGEPFLANIQHGVLYPGNLLFWLLPTSAALEWTIALHIALSGVAMWGYCRVALRTSAWAALLGGLAFAFSGQMIMHITLMNQLQVIAWMPAVLLFGHLALERGRPRYVVATALCIGMQLLAGHPEEWVYTLVALGLYGLVWSLLGGSGVGGWRGRARRALLAAARLGAAVVLFVLLFGWQLFPTLLLQQQGWRTSPSFDEQYPLAVATTMNALLPDFGMVLEGEDVAFVGVAVLALAGLGVVAGRRELRWVRIWFAVLAVAGLAMAVGARSPLYTFAYTHLGIMQGFRVPSRWLLLTTFAGAGAGALGLDVLLARDVGRLGARLRHAVLGLGAVAILFGIAGLLGNLSPVGASLLWWALAAGVVAAAYALGGDRTVPRAALAVALVLTTAVELSRARPYAEFREKVVNQAYDDPGPVMSRLGGEGGRYVTIAAPPETPEERALIAIPAVAAKHQDANYYRIAWGRQLVGRPAWEYAVHAETPLGRDGGLMPLRGYAEFFEASTGGVGMTRTGVYGTPPSGWRFEALDFLGVRWFITEVLPPREAAVLRQHGFDNDQREAYVRVWERPEPPIARMQYDVDVVPEAAERIRLLAAGYPLTSRVMVERPVRPYRRPVNPPTVEVVSKGHTAVRVKVTSDQAGLLVLADPWYPQWRASVDGRGVPILRANHGFRAVEVPGGSHEVVFTYSDRALLAGAGLGVMTVVALTVVALGVTRLVVRRRRW